MLFYLYKKSHFKDEMVSWLAYIYDRIPTFGMMVFRLKRGLGILAPLSNYFKLADNVIWGDSQSENQLRWFENKDWTPI